MRTLRRALTVLGAVTAILAATAIAVQADSSDLANPLVNPDTGGRYAEYNGEWIDLSQGWQGAQVCTEQPDTSFVCYDDRADFRAAEGLPTPVEGPGVSSLSDCKDTFVCLWDNQEYSVRLIRFNVGGYKDLSDTNFKDRANSYYNNRKTNTRMLDRHGSDHLYYFEATPNSGRGALSTFFEGRDGDGSWNNKIDYLTVRYYP